MHRPDLPPLLLPALLALLTACGPGGESPAGDAPTDGPAEHRAGAPEGSVPGPGNPDQDRADARTVAEAWQSPFHEPDNVDSVAFWQGEHQGSRVAWVVATGKESHDLLVYDAQTGELVRRVGHEGSGPSELRRPNGIQIVGDRLLVVERDNHRVQAFRLPGFDLPLVFGADVLRRPYGATTFESAPGQLELDSGC